MLSYKRILCPVDFSELSAQALGHAVELAGKSGGLVTAVYASSFVAPPYFTAGRMQELEVQFQQSQEEARQALGEFVRKSLPAGAGPVEAMVVEATPGDGILATAASSAADLIVMGTRGRTGLERYWMGSVTERVLRLAQIPVLVFRESAVGPSGGPSHVLCPVNNTALARRALKEAVELARSFSARLTIVHVEEDGTAVGGDFCQWVPEEMRGECEVKTVLVKGHAAEEIVRLARDEAVDLLVIGARHRRFSDTTVIGTTTARVVRHAPCPVLSIVEPFPRD